MAKHVLLPHVGGPPSPPLVFSASYTLTVHCKNARALVGLRLSALLGELKKLSWDTVSVKKIPILDITHLLESSHQLYSASAGGHVL